MGGFSKSGYLIGVPHNKDYTILGSILGSPYFGKLPYWLNAKNGNYYSGLRVSGLGLKVWV